MTACGNADLSGSLGEKIKTESNADDLGWSRLNNASQQEPINSLEKFSSARLNRERSRFQLIRFSFINPSQVQRAFVRKLADATGKTWEHRLKPRKQTF